MVQRMLRNAMLIWNHDQQCQTCRSFGWMGCVGDRGAASKSQATSDKVVDCRDGPGGVASQVCVHCPVFHILAM